MTMEEAGPPIYVKTVTSPAASPLSDASVDTFQTSLSPALDSDIIQPFAFVPNASATAQASETYIDEKAARGPAFRSRNAAPEPESSLLITAKSPLRIHKESAIVEDYRVAIADKPTLETATGAKSINKPDVHLDNTKGDIRTKLFLSGRQGEVFVRLYAAQGSIELSIDMDYNPSSSNIANSQLLKEAIRDMLIVIEKMLGLRGPEAARACTFGGSRTGLAVKCMHKVRKSAIEEEEADAYNKLLRQIKAMRSQSLKMDQLWNRDILNAEPTLGW